MAGYAMLNSDGQVRWTLADAANGLGGTWIAAAFSAREDTAGLASCDYLLRLGQQAAGG